jgi:hypothetical protein
MYLNDAQLKELITPFFMIIDDFCEKRTSEAWKKRVVKTWSQRIVKVDIIE